MKILMIGWEFPPYNSGGLGVACEGLAHGLARAGSDVVFVLPQKMNISSPHLRFSFAKGAFRTYVVNSALRPYLTDVSYNQGENKKPLYADSLVEEVYRYGEAIKEIAQTEDFDIIHAHDWLSYPAGLAAREVSGKPLVVHVHATEFDRTGGSGVNQEVYEIERRGMHEADKVISVSGYTKKLLTKHYGVNEGKVEVVHNGITHDTKNESIFPALSSLKKEGKKIVLFLGRITLQKGPDYFLEAARKVREVNKDAYFVVAGSGDMERQIIEESARLGIADRVLFAGFVRGEKLSRLYRCADVFVMPSVSEPFGITPLESLSHGVPVIISKQSGVSEVITSAPSVDFWDVEKLSRLIADVLSHEWYRDELVKRGQEEMMALTWDKAADKTTRVYNSLLL